MYLIKFVDSQQFLAKYKVLLTKRWIQHLNGKLSVLSISLVKDSALKKWGHRQSYRTLSDQNGGTPNKYFNFLAKYFLKVKHIA